MSAADLTILKTFKKSQMEILGLAIVVVLVLVALAFVVRYGFKPPANYRPQFVSAELASNMINTFLKTAAQDCNQLTMTELLQDCAQGTGLTCENGQDSCQYVESTADSIFASTLDKWNIKYEFSVYEANTNPFISKGTPCAGEKKSKIFPIPSSTTTIYVKLDICQ